MIVGTLRILPAPHRHAEVLEILQAVQGPVLAQPGCIACHVYEESLPAQAILLVDRWESQAALEAHLRSEIYRHILGAIELSGGPPEVCFDHVSATEGMDLIERSRAPRRTVDEKEHESLNDGHDPGHLVSQG
jgi:quinol monooxygenase YgiN